jgi:UPF0755 protein
MSLSRRVVRKAVRRRRETAMLIALVVLITGILFWRYAITPVNSGVATQTVNIPKGSGFFKITRILNDAGLVGNRPFFCILALGKGAEKHIRAGEYELSGEMTPSAILDKLVHGKIKVYEVLLTEDITVSDVARRLSTDKLINEKEFATLITDRFFLASLGIAGESIEGYLYPDTYRFDRSMTTREILQKLVATFWAKVTPEMRNRARELGLTQTQWVTLASIIGKESGNKNEKNLISAVFHNRLAKRMRLQSDPTAVYDLEKKGIHVQTVLRSHLKTDSPYNTYRIDGLPPGPIANPGIDSLQAALYPAKVDYLYFVYNNNGAHEFSRSLSAHNRAVSRHQTNRQKS